MKLRGKKCQCCGIPLAKDKEQRGTNADGTKNKEYCNVCLVNGRFTHNGYLGNLQKMNKQEMIDAGHSKYFIKAFDSWIKTIRASVTLMQ